MMLVNSLSGSSAKAFSSGVSSSSIQTSAYQGSSEDLNISKHQGKVKGSIAIVNYMTNPLQLAIQNKNVEAVKSLLDTTIITSDVATDLLITAIQSSEKSSMMLKDLLELGLRPYINDVHTKTGMTVLQTACLEGDLEGVQVLLDYKADKSIRDKMGHTALHKACQSAPLGDGGAMLPLVYLLLGIEATVGGGWTIKPDRLIEIQKTSSNVHLSFTTDGAIVDTPPPLLGRVLGDSLRTPDPLIPLGFQDPLPAGPVDPLNPIPDTVENFDPVNNFKEKNEEVSEGYKEIKVYNDTPVENKIKTPQEIIDEFSVAVAYELNLKGLDNKDCLLISAISGNSDILEFGQRVIDGLKDIHDTAEEDLRAEQQEALVLQEEALSDVILGNEFEISDDEGDDVTDNITIVEPHGNKDGVVIIDTTSELAGSHIHEDISMYPYYDNEEVEYLLSKENTIWVKAFVKSKNIGDIHVELATGEDLAVPAGEVSNSIRRIKVAEETTMPVELLEKVETKRKLSETEKYPDTSTDFSHMKIDLDKEISEKSKIKSIVWTESDITAALILSKNGNVECLKHLFDMDYDPLSMSKATGASLAMVAAEEGQLEVLDLLMNRHVNLTQKDRNMRSVLHYASTCTKEAALVYLLTHQKTDICKLSKLELIGQDIDGYTPLHVAAKCLSYGISLDTDFLLRSGLNVALELKDNKGMTPLLLACTNVHKQVVKTYLTLGANAQARDKDGHNSLWHLFHPAQPDTSTTLSLTKEISTKGIPIPPTHGNGPPRSGPSTPVPLLTELSTPEPVPELTRPIASEYVARQQGGGESASKLSALEGTRISSEVEVVVCLLQAGCPLYSESIPTPADINPEITDFVANMLIFQEQIELECGDIAAEELSASLFKAIPRLLSCEECWRLVLSSMNFHKDVNALMFTSLIEGGALDNMITLIESNYSTPGGLALIKSLDPKRDSNLASCLYSQGNQTKNSPKSIKNIKKLDKEIDSLTPVSPSFVDLQECFYDGFNVAGW
eukprot:CAMPEP_0119053626 /NCGR_PEP_ID=MMETSP1177-20130426/74545_1 /TAXON_ID=2985 /ORGANISM="Ochromonas sp, Strain CCMP1899" /LENGTH=1013 /DNA_ID=CAMNT_0007033627 /DNA_START=1343 /DNA_END=4381 /DNA_ORIENTATION=-